MCQMFLKQIMHISLLARNKSINSNLSNSQQHKITHLFTVLTSLYTPFYCSFAKKKPIRSGWFSFFACESEFVPHTTFGMSPTSAPCADRRANNLQPKRKGFSILFATVDGTKQGVWRVEHAQARADDYATAAEGREENGQSICVANMAARSLQIVLYIYEILCYNKHIE